MKKKLISLLVALLVLAAMLPCAFAERVLEFDLGSYEVGKEINCLVTDIESNAQIGSVVMPDSLSISTKDVDGVLKLYVKGSLNAAGSTQFTLPVDAGEETYYIKCLVHAVESAAPVIPSVGPTVSTSADISCALGDTAVISVTAYSADGGALSYQWYSNAAGRIDGATGNTYSPNTFLVGTQEYFCIVTSTRDGRSASTTSAAIMVNVMGAPTLKGIYMMLPPTKLNYLPGETLDTSGMAIIAQYTDGREEIIDSGFEISPFFFTSNGVQQVNIGYEGYSVSFNVTVGTAAESFDRLEVREMPDKNMYKVGDMLDVSGIGVYGRRLDGGDPVLIDVRELEFSPTRLDTAGEQRITVKYGDKVCYFTVSVEDDKTDITIVSLPYKTVYTVGDRLDTNGLVISLNKGGRTDTVSTGFTCTPKVLTTAGEQEITVIYGGVNTCTFKVTVNEKEHASATPAPTPTPKPSSVPTVTHTPKPSYTPSRHEAHSTSFAGTLMKVILVIAIFSLVGLGAYVVVMRKKGKK